LPPRKPREGFAASGRRLAGRALAMALLYSLAILGCSRGPDDGLPGSSPLRVGILVTLPHIEGDWHSGATVITDGCGTSIFPLVNETIIRVTQADTVLALEVSSACGTLLSEGTGTIDTNGAATLTYDEKIAVSTTCTLKLHHALTGTFNSSHDQVSGDQTITISALGDCGSSLPCQISESFLAQKCPPASCAFRTCPSP
jgi:hypothetical protein